MKPNVLVIDGSSTSLTRVALFASELMQVIALPDLSSLSAVIREHSPDVIVLGGEVEYLSMAEDNPVVKRGSSFGQRLTFRQKEILIMLRAGFRNDDMARNLHVSVRTVKAYLNQLFTMFDVSNRTELLGSVVDLGILAELCDEVALTELNDTAEAPPNLKPIRRAPYQSRQEDGQQYTRPKDSGFSPLEGQTAKAQPSADGRSLLVVVASR